MKKYFIALLVLLYSLLNVNFLFATSNAWIQEVTFEKTAQPAAVSNMLQYKAGGHIMGFQPTKVYMASLDHALSMEFLGTKGVMPTSTETIPATNTLTKASILTKASTLTKVLYANLWEGISLTYESTKDGITESTYHIAPGADVSQIRLRYNVPVTTQKDGSLKFTFERGYLTESKPIAWQDINGKRIPVTIAFNVSNDEVGFTVGAYNPREPLIIDPTYAWHTFYGGSGEDDGNEISIDTNGNIYVTGTSEATWGSPLNAHSGGYDVVILKLNSSGAYQWHTFYGSSSYDKGYGIAVDTSGNVYVTGVSSATWGNPLNAYTGTTEIFVLKLDSSGAYQWHTFYGSGDIASIDYGYGIAVDTGGNVYVTGRSNTTWGSPLHASNPGNDIFILKLNNSGAYQWHTFYGSANGDYGYAIVIDTGGNIYVTGRSDMTWGSPLNAFSGGYGDIVVLKLDSSGAYQWHTFYGSNSHDYAEGIAVDTGGNVYVTGYSAATWGPPLNAHSGSDDLVVLKLDSSGAYQWHTFYGSSNIDLGYGIVIDTGGSVYITGYSESAWGSPLNAYGGNNDLFVLKLNSSGAYQWHTFYGSSNVERGYDIALDTASNIYVTGWSNATWGSPLHAYGGNSDILVLKLNGDGDIPPMSLYASFPGAGIWKWNGTEWTQTTPNTPEQMVTSGTTLYGSFTGGGIWKWDGTNWTQVTPNNPQAMVTLGTDLYGTFTGAGIWKWDGTTWTQVTPNNPQSMVMLGTDLYGAFTGQGIWKWNGSTWTQATPNTPDIMVATGTTLYGSFAGGGIWKWDGATWTQATPNNPQLLVAQGENLFGSFTGQGIWKWDSSTWTQATPNNPQQMVSSSTELYGAFTGGGIWKWDGSTWTQVTPNTPVSMVLEGGEIFLDHFDSYPLGTFPTSGGWILRYNGAGDAYQYIDNTHSLSGQQSMHMVGSSCWSSAMYHPLNLSSQVTYEAKVFVDAIVSCGCTPSLAVVRLINPSLGEWGTAFGSISFNCDGNIYAMQATDPTSNVLLMPYNAQQWYKIKLKVNLVTRTFDVYVNDVLKGSDFQILDSGNPTGIEVLADHGNDPTVWFDDILVQ